MNQADILKLADSFIYFYPTTGGRLISNCNSGDDITEELTRFAELVAQHERGRTIAILQKLHNSIPMNENELGYMRCHNAVCTEILKDDAERNKS